MEGIGSGLFEVLYRNFLEKADVNHTVMSVRISGVPVEGRNQYPQNTKPELRLFANPVPVIQLFVYIVACTLLGHRILNKRRNATRF
jgi:hypothetical protein